MEFDVTPRRATAELDGSQPVVSPFTVPHDGRPHTLAFRAPGHTTHAFGFVADRPQRFVVRLHRGR